MRVVMLLVVMFGLAACGDDGEKTVIVKPQPAATVVVPPQQTVIIPQEAMVICPNGNAAEYSEGVYRC